MNLLQKNMRNRIAAIALSLGAAGMATPATAGLVEWTDWTFAAPGSAVGTLDGMNVTYTGEIGGATQVSGGIDYWNPATPFLSATVSNAPPAADIITLIGGLIPGTQTPRLARVEFSAPVTNPVMAIMSLGQSGILVDYVFDASFNVLSFGPGYWGGPGTLTNIGANTRGGQTLRGQEGHGTIQFIGEFSSISWTIPVAENWHGFQIGLVSSSNGVPEPASLALLATALAVLGFRANQRSRIL